MTKVLRPRSSGFTLVESLITAALASVFMLMVATWLRSGGSFLHKSISSHDLELEAADVSGLLTSLLRRSDPSSIVLQSGPGGPWSHIRFASGAHRYEFYGDGKALIFITDGVQSKVLSAHLTALQFSLARSRLPTLLSWSVRLGTSQGSTLSAQTSLSGVQFLERPQE